MTQYIDKAAVVAEIGRLKGYFVNERDDFEKGYHKSLDAVSDYLNTLEVKEVDLSLIEPHIKEEWNKINTGHTYSIIDSYNIFVGICTYFYELGIKAQKGE